MHERLRGKPWQYIAAWTGGLTLFSAGTVYGWINPVIDHFESPETPMKMTPTQISLVASLPELGSLITALPGGLLADTFGRKMVLIIATPLTLITWIVIIFTHNIIVLILARTVQGLAIGLTSTAFPMYISEIAEPSVRGSLGNIFVFAFCLGQVYEYAIGPFVSYETLAILSMIPNVVLLLTFVWFRETPYYLLMKGQVEKSQKSLRTFRKGSTTDEFKSIQTSINQEKERKESQKSIFTTAVGRKGLVITSVIATTVFMGGIQAVLSYSSKIFFKVSGDKMKSEMFTLGMGILLCIGALVSSFLLDNWGRKPTMIFSHLGNFACLLIPAIYYGIFSKGNYKKNLCYIPVTSIVLASLFSLFSVCAIKVYQSELFSTATRGLATGINTFICGFVGTVTIFIFTALDEIQLLYINFIIFSSFSLIGGVFVYFFAPETKGKTFDEIQSQLIRRINEN